MVRKRIRARDLEISDLLNDGSYTLKSKQVNKCLK